MRSRFLLAFAVILASALTPLTPAAADPLEASVALPFNLTIQGANGRSEVLAPLPDGAVPTTLSGAITANYNYPGVVSLTVAGRRAAEVDATTGGEINVPLLPTDVVDGRVSLLMNVRLSSQEDCFADDTAAAALTDAQISYQIPQTPTDTIASFLSPGVQQYSVVISPSASPAAHSAALTAVSALTLRFPAPTAVQLLATDDVPASSYLDRVIVFTEQSVAEGETNTVEVLNGSMSITGEAAGLMQAATALADPNTGVLRQPATSDLSTPANFAVREGPVSLKDLGVGTIELTGVGRQQSLVSINQPMFGQQIESLRLNLSGALSPLPEGGQGRVDLSWNEEVLTSIPMSSNPNFSRLIEIPTAQLGRENTLGIAFYYSPPGGACFPPGMPATLSVDTLTSTAEAAPGISLGPGFGRFPQALQSTVPIALDTGLPLTEALAAGGNIVAALQSASPQQYTFEVQSIDAAGKDGRPAVLVGATETTASRFGAPLRDADPTRIGVGTPTFQAALMGPYSALQAYSQDERNLIALTTVNPTAEGAGDVAMALSQYANDPPTRWSKLTGQVVVMGADGEAITTDITQPPPPNRSLTILVATVIGFTVVALLLLFWLWHRPRGQAPAPPGGDTVAPAGGESG